MNLRYVAWCGLLSAAALVSGCDEGRKAPGKATVLVANVAPGFETLTFRREQNVARDEELLFKGAGAHVYDADTYDFNVLEPPVPGTGERRTWTFSPTLDADKNYTFVLTEVAGEVQPVVIELPPPPAGDAAQIVALNAASGLPAMDLYLERPGVGIAGATPRGTFNAMELLTPITLPSGDYELFLTTAGNPSDVLLTSATITLPATTTSTFIVAAENGMGTVPISVVLIQAAPTVLYSTNATSELRIINGATDQAPRDVAIASEFSPPLFSAVPFGDPTHYAPVVVGTQAINVTPVGNPGVLEVDTTYFGISGQRGTMLFSGPAGTLTSIFAADDGRRLHREAKLRFMTAATQFPVIDFVLTLPDSDPNLVPSQATLFPPGISNFIRLPTGEYDLYTYPFNSTTALSGPTRINLSAGGIYSVLAVDGPDTSTVTVRLLDDFAAP